jgi:7-cyano-7-deazaguanine reductase
VIQSLPNKFAGREYEVELADPEFTSICPLTGAPDFGTLTIRYVPGEKLLELKSLRDYLGSFRGREILQEEIVNEVLDEVVSSAAPRRAEVEGIFNMRGGMTTRVAART